MVTLQQDMQIQSTIIEHWWRHTRRENRLCIRLLREKPEHLAQLARLQIIINKIDNSYIRTMRAHYPEAVYEFRSFFLSVERNFIECLRAIHVDDMAEAEKYYHSAHDDLSLLQYLFMEQGVESNI